MAVFFVGGSPRSGTTLLQAVLCGASSTNSLTAEAGNFTSLVQVYLHGKATWDSRVADFFETPESFREFCASIVDQYLATVRNRLGCDDLVLKHPSLTVSFPDLHELQPTIKYLVIVRHPLDVIASMIKVGRKLHEIGQQCPFPYLDIEAMCAGYTNTYGRVVQACEEIDAFRSGVMWVRYEDLVVDHDPVIRAIGEFTSLDLSGFDAGSDWNIYSHRGLAPDHRQEAFISEISGHGISDAKLGGYRSVLSTEDHDSILRQCAQVTQYFGYDESKWD